MLLVEFFNDWVLEELDDKFFLLFFFNKVLSMFVVKVMGDNIGEVIFLFVGDGDEIVVENWLECLLVGNIGIFFDLNKLNKRLYWFKFNFVFVVEFRVM